MGIALYGHPFSSYTWKALIGFYEQDVPFEFRPLGPDQPDNGEALDRLSPSGQFPLLLDGERVVFESSAIIDYVDGLAPQRRLIPADPEQALTARMLDRLFDHYVMAPMQAVVSNALRPPEERHPPTVTKSLARLDRLYRWLEGHLADDREWAAGDTFTLADCAAAPSLFYADWVHRIPEEFGALRAYRARLLARPSVARCVEDARPYRDYFPLGAPDRD